MEQHGYIKPMNKKKSTSTITWVEAENGYEYLKSPQMIARILKDAKKKPRYLTLLHKNYQSGATVLVTVGRKAIGIDLPVDWPEGAGKVRVLFRDDSKIWNYFTTKIISKSKKTLKIAFPTELFRMQRRAYFRVHMPSKCRVSLISQGEKFANLGVDNISLSGMLMDIPPDQRSESFGEAELLTDIVIMLPSGEGDAVEVLNISISEGLIVRVHEMENGRKTFGIQFNLQRMEEKALMQFVRHSELANIRKGL